MDQDRPHLRSVPDTGLPGVPEDIAAAPPPIQGGEVVVEQPPQHIAPVIGFGDMPAPVAGSTARLGTHALAVSATGATGAAVGFLASGELRGAVVGAGAQLTLLGLAGALFGAGRMPGWLRITYGVMALGAGATASYLVWTRR